MSNQWSSIAFMYCDLTTSLNLANLDLRHFNVAIVTIYSQFSHKQLEIDQCCELTLHKIALFLLLLVHIIVILQFILAYH